MRKRATQEPTTTPFDVREAIRRATIARSIGIPTLPIEGYNSKLAVVPPRRETPA